MCTFQNKKKKKSGKQTTAQHENQKENDMIFFKN